MKKLLLSLIAVAISTALFASEPERGYRGFVEWDNNITSYKLSIDSRKTYWFTGVSTSHGFQFNKNFFLGAGLMFDTSTDDNLKILPAFVQVRTDQTWGRFTPFGDLRIGYNFTDGGGMYISPTIGYRFNWGRKMNLNVGVGMTLRGSEVHQWDITYFPDYLGTGNGAYDLEYRGSHHEFKPMFNFRIGIDF